MHRFRIFRYGLRATMNLLRLGLQRFVELTPLRLPAAQTIMQCLRFYVFVHMMLFTKEDITLLKFLRQDKCYSAIQLLKEIYHWQVLFITRSIQYNAIQWAFGVHWLQNVVKMYKR